ncbi:MAG: methylenetetrahydrofolate reductase [Pseudomonadota bacterium]
MATPTLSFEFFPPRDLAASFRLWDAAQALLPLGPRHVSVTYGAGGSTQSLTHETVEALSAQGADVAAHLTCGGATRAETLEVARRYRAAGVRDVVALRGDGPAVAGGFQSSLELVEALAREGFGVHVGAYAEAHPESRGPRADIEWLRAKFQVGATLAVSQFFFEAATFLRFRDACADAGLPGSVVPGILPVHNWRAAARFAQRCGVTVPPELVTGFETADRHGRAELFALSHATELCSTLIDEGVEHLHIYTLNRPTLTRTLCRALGITAEDPLRKVA